MFRWGRSVEPFHSQSEPLYMWFAASALGNNGELSPTGPPVSTIRFPVQSTCRALFSHPYDVLFPSLVRHGVLSFTADCLPVEYKPGDSPIAYTLRPVHRPLVDNFAHTDIVTSKNAVEMGNDGKVPTLVKKLTRESIAQRAVVIRRPTPTERFAWLRRRWEAGWFGGRRSAYTIKKDRVKQAQQC